MDTLFKQYGNNFLYSLLGLFGAVVVLLLLSAPISYQETKNEVTPFQTRDETSQTMELGESNITSQGLNGEDEVTYDSTGSILQRIFSQNEVTRKEIKRTVITAPVEKVVTNGTLKYQYMYCSDGSYRYYTDEQFTNPSTGFTSKSEDACSKNGNGFKTRIASEPPAPKYQPSYTNTYNGGGAICRDGWHSYSTGRGTCSWHGGVAYYL